MHFYTLHELKKMHLGLELPLFKITPEQEVLLEKHGLREGRFDFLVESSEGKLIGFEVLTRPSKGKLKEKLAYSKEVDTFVFVLPNNSLGLYRKLGKKTFHRIAREKSMPKEFNSPSLYVWLFNPKDKRFVEKALFSKVFNVESR